MTSGSSTVTTPVDYAPGLSILKTISSITDTNHDGKTDAGDVVNYNVHVTNTGDVTLTGVTVNDPLTGGVISSGQTIAVGGSEDIGASYTLSQGDVDNKGNPVNSGLISNTASATDDQGDSGSSTVTTPVDYTPGLSILKTISSITDSNHDGKTDAGDVINYNVHVANTGDVTLTGVTVNDPLTGGVISTGQTIAVGGSEDIAASYTLTQGDVDLKGNPVNSGLISNTASATDDQGDSGSSTVTTPVDYTPGLSILKTISSITDTNHDGKTDAGDVINYNVHVANTGDVTLTGVTVTDPLTGGVISTGQTIAVGGSEDIGASYTITVADGTAGKVVNIATVTDNQGDSGSSSVTTPTVSPQPGLKIVKTVTCITDKNCDRLTDAGDVITYDIKVTNTGTTTLTGIVVTDPLTGGTVASGVTLAAGKSLDYVRTYTIKQTDVDHDGNPTGSGLITNTATATDKQGNSVSSTVSTPIDYKPGVSIVKTVSCINDKNCDGKTDAGDVITYSIKVTNTGDVTLTGVNVQDPLTGGTVASGVTLAIGASKTYTKTYTLTQADVDNKGVIDGSADKKITNTATVTDDQGVGGSSSVTVPVTYAPGLKIVKSVSSIIDTNHDGKNDAGDVINYDIKVTNTGDVTLTGVVVTDPLTGGALTPSGGVSIAVGGVLDLTNAHYTITSTDVAKNGNPAGSGIILNTATVTDNQGDSGSDTASVSVKGFTTGSCHNTSWWCDNHYSYSYTNCGWGYTQTQTNNWCEASYGGKKGILIGDYTGTAWCGGGSSSAPKSLSCIPNGMLFISDADACTILNSTSTDCRIKFAQQAITGQLNIDNGADDPGYSPFGSSRAVRT